MAQEITTFDKYIKAILGLRYSYINNQDDTSAGPTTGNTWNPMLDIMLTPIKNINLFGSYIATTDLLHATRRIENGGEIGLSSTHQFKVGIKSGWLNNHLRFNLAYFDILTKDLFYNACHPGTTQPTGCFDKAGNLKRKGIGTKLSGSILENLQIMMGYTYLGIKYENSPALKNGSASINTPRHAANGWIRYRLDEGVLKRLSASIGVYFVDKHPVDDFTIKPDGHGSMTNEKPFDMSGYTTISAQLAYSIHKFTARVYLDNLFDALGCNSYYHGGYINQVDPRNLSAIISHHF